MTPDSNRPIDVETLLAHAGWVRALALRLVREESSADDVLQDTLTAALERPPRPHVPLGPWLARVAQNFAFRALRTGSRRRRREAARALPPAPPTVEESALRTERFHEVVGAVLRLDAAYRDVVILRFFEGLNAHAAAERLGVPFETARTRLRRALALLRAQLDQKYGGRRAWAIALLPLADVSRAVATGTAGSTATAGGLLMATSVKTVAGIGLAGALAGAALTVAATALTNSGSAREPEARNSAGSLEARAPEVRGTATNAPETSARLEGAAPTGGVGGPTARTIAALLADAEIVLPTSVPGTITGHVRTQDGRPLAGAVVRAWAFLPGADFYRSGYVPEQPSAEETVRNAARQAKWTAATQREARTDATGAYALEDLADLDYYMSAWAEGHEVRVARHSNASQVRAGGAIDFVASALVTQAVVVLLPNGRMAARATVRWGHSKRGGGGASEWRGSEPQVQMEPGTWDVHAELGQEMLSPSVTVTAGAAGEPVTLRLEVRNAIRGTVRLDPADDAWRYVFVTARRRDGPTSVSLRANPQAPDWTFRFDDLSPGEYEVSAGVTEHVAAITAVVRVTEGIVEQTLVLPRLTATHVLQARVLGADGKPVSSEDVSFGILERRGNTSTGYGARSTQRADGTFLIAVMSPESANRERVREAAAAGGAGGGRDVAGRPGGAPAEAPREGAATYFLQVSLGSFGRKEIEFIPGHTSRVEVSFE